MRNTLLIGGSFRVSFEPDVICLTNGPFQENCFIVADRSSGQAALVDPGEEAGLFLARLKTENLRLEAIWLTHAHIDHIMGIEEVVQATGAPVYLHAADRQLYNSIEQQGGWLGVRARPQPAPDHELVATDLLRLGQFEFEVREVPGHSPGSVALVGPGMVFSGDAIFSGSIGRTDLPGGDFETLINSISTQLLSLPDETVVFSGHGPETTIGAERRGNQFLQGI